MKSYIPSILIFLACFSAKAQTPVEILGSVNSIADKVIRETSFEYIWDIRAYNAGISDIKPPCQDENSVFYAYSRIHATEDSHSFISISYTGKLKVFLNGKEIFFGQSETSVFQEYTYDRFLFNEKIPVELSKGLNDILIKFSSDPKGDGVLFLLSDSNDFQDKKVNLIPFVSTSKESDWILCGPFQSPGNEPIENIFPPEKRFESFYIHDNKKIGWSTLTAPLIRELKIDDKNSYKKESYAEWHYASGETMFSIYSLYKLTEDKKYLDFLEKYTSNIIDNLDYFGYQYHQLHVFRGNFYRFFRMTMLDDSGGPCLPFSAMMCDNPSYPFRTITSKILDYVLNKQMRLPDSTFCRPEPEPETVWADDLFMTVPFLLEMAKISGNDHLYDEVSRQIINFDKYLRNPDTGLYFHGWYNDRKENTPVQWGRANGWIAWAVSEALLHLPGDHKDYDSILSIFQNHIAALVKYQNENGMWNQVLDDPGTYDETSCSAMFTLAIARGVRMGWIKKSYKKVAQKGWDAISQQIDPDGTVKGICRGTGIGDDIEFYAQQRNLRS